jgi:hypothetical protein
MTRSTTVQKQVLRCKREAGTSGNRRSNDKATKKLDQAT